MNLLTCSSHTHTHTHTHTHARMHSHTHTHTCTHALTHSLNCPHVVPGDLSIYTCPGLGKKCMTKNSIAFVLQGTRFNHTTQGLLLPWAGTPGVLLEGELRSLIKSFYVRVITNCFSDVGVTTVTVRRLCPLLMPWQPME